MPTRLTTWDGNERYYGDSLGRGTSRSISPTPTLQPNAGYNALFGHEDGTRCPPVPALMGSDYVVALRSASAACFPPGEVLEVAGIEGPTLRFRTFYVDGAPRFLEG